MAAARVLLNHGGNHAFVAQHQLIFHADSGLVLWIIERQRAEHHLVPAGALDQQAVQVGEQPPSRCAPMKEERLNSR